MEPSQLYNQLRFNLEQPYNINKLSVRHKHPRPIIIEKTGDVVRAPANVEQTERELASQFSELSVEKLKEAQFLAKRQIKKERDGILLTSPKKGQKGRRPDTSNTVKKISSQRLINKQPLKVTPSKRLHHLPIAGNSPPVRDTSNAKAKSKSGNARRCLNKKSPTGKQAPAVYTSHGNVTNKPVYHNGILKEKLNTSDHAHTMPDLHKMAMDQLLLVQRGELPTQLTTHKSTPNRAKKGAAKTGKSPGMKKFSLPSYRAEASRIMRERIYRQPLTHPLPYRPAIAYASPKPKTPKKRKGRILPRHNTAPQFDPDYDYVDPDDILENARHQVLSAQKQTSRDLPNADEFLQRVMEARRAKEASQSYVSVDHKKVVEEIEREARQRLEPVIERAERLSEDVRRALHAPPKSSLFTVNPQYHGGHEGEDVSADDLLHHPVDSHICRRTQAIHSQYSRPQAIPGAESGDIHIDTHPNSLIGSGSLSAEDLNELEIMLRRLDQLESEQVAIRQRWLSSSNRYSTPGLVAIEEPQHETSRHVSEAVFDTEPCLLLLKKSHASNTRNRNVDCTSNLHSTLANYIPHKSNLVPQEVVLSLPSDKIKSIEDGKRRFERHLANTNHTVSAGFNPWVFATEIANEALEKCLEDLAQEYVEAGDSLIQGLYADEFVAAQNSPPTAKTFPT